ncbi:hypothetical protein RF11_16192 [Thelohanellus kitauei]|uniref:receptor protein-tyrosine kinase n=1 Tax=Thelohanellus kitauei TaxID=669202 RepID=A0A0C2NKR8_THEKT|nr:hypothetical protein RF11_16192 [Thelohanellus kitauei]
MKLINEALGTPIRFRYNNFENVDRLFCKYENSTLPFASYGPEQLGGSSRMLKTTSTDYQIVNSSIGINGYFGIKILGRIDRDDENVILCQYSTRFTIGSSQAINLFVIAPVKIKPFISPVNPMIGDTVTLGCIIEGYPYPTVEILTPKNTQYQAVQMNPPTTKLISYKYVVTIPNIDETWDNKRLYCYAIQTGGRTIEHYVAVHISNNDNNGNNPSLVISITLGLVGTLLLIILIACLIAMFIRRRSKKRQETVQNAYQARGNIIFDSVPNIEQIPVLRPNVPVEENQARIFRQPENPTNAYEVSRGAFI